MPRLGSRVRIPSPAPIDQTALVDLSAPDHRRLSDCVGSVIAHSGVGGCRRANGFASFETPMRIPFIFAVACFLATPALAQQPVLKSGSCPTGYHSSGNYCVPGSNAQPVIEKNGSCPSGYASSGNYCVMGSSGKPAIPKSGSCPSGYHSSGNYCVQSR